MRADLLREQVHRAALWGLASLAFEPGSPTFEGVDSLLFFGGGREGGPNP